MKKVFGDHKKELHFDCIRVILKYTLNTVMDLPAALGRQGNGVQSPASRSL